MFHWRLQFQGNWDYKSARIRIYYISTEIYTLQTLRIKIVWLFWEAILYTEFINGGREEKNWYRGMETRRFRIESLCITSEQMKITRVSQFSPF